MRQRLELLASLTVLLAVGGALLVWGWSSMLADFSGDNAVYWLTARHWSPWAAPSDVAAHFAARSVYPPLYPLFLAVTGGGDSVLVAHAVSALLVVIALAVAFVLCRRFGLGVISATVVVACFATTRITLLETIQLHSEHLYLLMSLLAMWLLAAASVSRRSLYAAALCVGAAYLTRSFGIALVLAFIVTVLQQRWPGRWLALVIVLLPVGGWIAWSSGDDRYVAAMLELYRDAGIGNRLVTNLEWMWRKWSWCFAQPEQSSFDALLPAIIALAAVGGAVLRAYRHHFDGYYVIAALGLIALWPYPAEYERFYYPLLPVLFAQGGVAVRHFARQATGPGVERAALPLFLAIIVAAQLSFLVLFIARISAPLDAPGYGPYRRTTAWFLADPATAVRTVGYQRGVIEALADIRARGLLPAPACMLAIKPSVTSFYLGRIAYAMPRPAPREQLVRALRASRCEYVFMTQGHSPTFPEGYYPYERVADELEIVDVFRNPASLLAPVAILARLKRP